MSSAIEQLLASDHSEIDAILARVFAALDSGCRDEILLSLDRFWARLAVHIRAEHKELFPTLVAVAQSKLGSSEQAGQFRLLIDDLRRDHSDFMRQLAILVSNEREEEKVEYAEIRQRLEVLSSRLALHNEIEESNVYSLANRLLSESDAVGLCTRIEMELRHMPPRFVQSNI
jgi:hemerythrin-like domain-containing protein